MSADQAIGLAAGLIGAVLFGVGAVAQAQAVRRQSSSPDTLASFVATSVRDPWTMLVVAAYIVGFALHAVAIWLLPLYLAQAVVSMSLPVTAIAAGRVGERLSGGHWVAVGAVTGGLALLSLGSGTPGSVVTSTTFVVLVYVGAVALALASVASARLSPGVLGALAGLGYAGSAIAVRGVGTPLGVAVVLSALSVPAFSLIAFWLYSLGMNNAAVSSATAPLIVAQTFVPAAVGVILLGDGVRAGWWPAVIAGLALATVGAIRLSHAPADPALVDAPAR